MRGRSSAWQASASGWATTLQTGAAQGGAGSSISWGYDLVKQVAEQRPNDDVARGNLGVMLLRMGDAPWRETARAGGPHLVREGAGPAPGRRGPPPQRVLQGGGHQTIAVP